MYPIDARATDLRTLSSFAPRIWSAPDSQGYMHVVRSRTYRDLITWLRERLVAIVLHDGARFDATCDYFGLTARFEHDLDAPLPQYRWICCYAVTGGSEGHYVHVDYLVDDGTAILRAERVITAKTFDGMERALELARVLTYLLGA